MKDVGSVVCVVEALEKRAPDFETTDEVARDCEETANDQKKTSKAFAITSVFDVLSFAFD